MAMRPVPELYPVTQNFYADATAYNYGAGHGAIDYGVPIGTPLLAPEDGVVVFDGWAWDLPGGPYDWGARFYQIKPDRGDTRTGGGIMTIIRNAAGSHWVIAHANKSLLNAGDRVHAGDLIQETGTTGSSTGPHSHVSLIPPGPDWGNGYFGAVDPSPYLTEPYRPRTYVAWQGSPTHGVGATVTEGDWFDMATKKELEEVVLAAVQRELTYPRQKLGPHAGGTVSIQDEILHLASNFATIARAVNPSTIKASVVQAVTEVGVDIDADELAQKIAQQLLAAVLTTTTQEGA